jgi:nitroreductase
LLEGFMSAEVPPSPQFGEPCPIKASPDTLALLAGRRSTSAALLQAPGPDAGEIDKLIRLSARVPDHGKLAPWRFVVLEGAAKARLVEALKPLADKEPNPEKAVAALAKLSVPPVSVLVAAKPPSPRMPAWEQELSAGAVCMTMLIAAEAMGYGANWITDWYSYQPEARALMGLEEGERVAGFIHLGTPAEPPLERDRPDLNTLVSRPA